MKKIRISRYFVFLCILTFLAIFTFIVQTGYDKLIGPVKEVKSGTILNSIEPNLDQDIIHQIKNKEEFRPEDFFVQPTSTATVSGQPNQP